MASRTYKFHVLPQIFRNCQVRCYSAPGDGVIPAVKQKYVPKSGKYPLGFLASSTHVGVKPSNSRFDDIALIASERPCAAAAVFTKNKFQAAPVTVSRETLRARKGEGIKAVIVNSGCANAVTGQGGLEDARAMAAAIDASLPEPNKGDVPSSLVMSTGVIGQRLPINKIISTSDPQRERRELVIVPCKTPTGLVMMDVTFSCAMKARQIPL